MHRSSAQWTISGRRSSPSAYWNSGIFLFPAAVYLAELERLRPDIWPLAKKLPGLSPIDYAVMERTASKTRRNPAARHRLQSGSYLGEDDIVRFVQVFQGTTERKPPQ